MCLPQRHGDAEKDNRTFDLKAAGASRAVQLTSFRLLLNLISVSLCLRG